MTPDSMLTSAEACRLQPNDDTRPATDDRLRTARQAGEVTAVQDVGGRRAWRYRLGDLVTIGMVSPAVYADGAVSSSAHDAEMERLRRDLADLRADYRVLRDLVTRLVAEGGA